MVTNPFSFDAARYLTSPESQAELVADALEAGDADYIAAALGAVARARGEKARYDPDSDALSIRFTDDEVAESEKVAENAIFDFDRDGRIVGVEILHARIMLPTGVDFSPKARGRARRSQRQGNDR